MAVKKSFVQVTQQMYDDLIGSLELLNEEYYRPVLNRGIHVVDLNRSALSSSADQQISESVHRKILEALKWYKGIPVYNSIESISLKEDIYIVKTASIHALVGPDFETTSTYCINAISGYPPLTGKFLGATDLFNSTADLGHTPKAEAGELTSPAELKLKTALSLSGGNAILGKIITNKLKELYKLHGNAKFTFKNNTPELLDFTKKITNNGTLGTLVVALTIHDRSYNRSLGGKEGSLISKLIKELKDILVISGSNNILEDIEQSILDTLRGKKTTKAHPQQQITKEISSKTKDIKSTSSKLKVQLRNLRGHFTSLASLQTLLNQALSEQIRKNMGTGNETRILNYRTGRFASSAKVEKMSQSREGMLTAFYTYMKYPYATFSEGGLQQNPRSRDPKLLISKSIREIGASLVKNRMRAVSL